MKLLIPSTTYEQSYLDAIEEHDSESNDTVLKKPNVGQSFQEFVQHKIEEAQGLQLPEGYVPATELWLVDTNEFIGRVSIRHSLTPHLLQLGGHIGYWIRPTKRNMGYGKALLKLALPEAKKLGLTKVLLTCDETNRGSQKIIEANGGVLENSVANGENHPRKRRYWVEIR